MSVIVPVLDAPRAGFRVDPRRNATSSTSGRSYSFPTRADASATHVEVRPVVTELPELVLFLTPQPIGSGLELVAPIVVTAECDGGWFVISDNVLGLYGDAPSLDEAIQDYLLELVDLYRFWKEEVAAGRPLEPSLAAVSRYVKSAPNLAVNATQR
mgnify:CR=1 FL=1